MKLLLFLIGFCITTISVLANDVVVVKSNYNQLQDTLIVNNHKLTFHFRFNETDFENDYMSNKESLGQLDKLLYDSDLVSTIETLSIITTASPDGVYSYNIKLSKERALAFRIILIDRYPLLAGVEVNIGSNVADWSELKKFIETDLDLPWWGTVMSVLNEDRDHGAIYWLLKQVGDGESWKYIVNNYLKYLRVGDMTIQTTYKKELSNIIKVTEVQVQDTITALVLPNIVEPERKDFLALKTNLLFDALSLVNLEVEVPIGKRWSVAGEWIFPWWVFDNGKADSRRHRIQMLSGSLEGRYWFGNRVACPVMTGWFAGAYVGGGIYDFEYNAKGYQGEFFIMGGLSGGYAHTVNKKGNIRMEYSLGVGYIQTDYRYYESHFANTSVWHPLYSKGGRYSWIGPTKAKISLVWMLNKRGVQE